MDLQKRTPTTEILPRLRNLFRTSLPDVAIPQALLALSLGYQQRVDLSKETYALYLESLESLTPDQLALAFSRAQLEPHPYFPQPGELRALAGIETSAQHSEREAREALSWLFWWINKFSVEGRPRRGAKIREAGWVEEQHADGMERKWLPEEFEWEPPTAIPDRTRVALAEFGAGDAQHGMRLVGEHPLLKKNFDSLEPSRRLWAVKDFEALWLEAWRRSDG